VATAREILVQIPDARPARPAGASVVAPYTFAFLVWGMQVCEIHLHRLDPGGSGARRWPIGITQDLADFLAAHGRCHFCGAHITSPPVECLCRRGARTLIIAFDREAHENEWKSILAREDRRARSRVRAAAVQAAGGRVRPSELRALLDAQQRLCFWCAASLMDRHGVARFHADHYVPVANGGTSDLGNTVLACAECNLEKSDASPEAFERRMRKRRSPEQRALLAEMRRRLAAWRRRRAHVLSRVPA